MKPAYRPFLICGLVLVLLSSACGMLAGASPTPVGTILPDVQTDVPTFTATVSVTATGTSSTPLIPITGENVVSMQCQFCVNYETHAVLVIPDLAYFDIETASPVTCFTAHVVNGQRILICRGAQQTSFNLNICVDNTDCLQFPVVLQECPLIQAGNPLVTSTPPTPIFLTAIGTFRPTREDDTPNDSPSSTPTQPSITPPPAATTAPPPATSTPDLEPTDEPEPTYEPVPTPSDPPPPTDEPTSEPTEPREQSRPTRK